MLCVWNSIKEGEERLGQRFVAVPQANKELLYRAQADVRAAARGSLVCHMDIEHLMGQSYVRLGVTKGWLCRQTVHTWTWSNREIKVDACEVLWRTGSQQPRGRNDLEKVCGVRCPSTLLALLALWLVLRKRNLAKFFFTLNKSLVFMLDVLQLYRWFPLLSQPIHDKWL